MKPIAIIDPASYTLPYDYYYLKNLDVNAAGIDFYASYKQEHLLDYLNYFKKVPYCNLKLYNISRTNKALGLVQYFLMLCHITKNYQRYEYIHFQWSIFFPLELLFFAVFRKKLLFTFHNPVPHNKKRSSHLPFHIIYKLCKKAIFLSKYSQQTFLNLNKVKNSNKSKVIPHPDMAISPLYEEIPSSPNNIEKKIIFWGNVKPYKGVDFFETMAQDENFNEYTFEIYGKWDSNLKPLKSRMKAIPKIKIYDKFLGDDELFRLMKRNVTFILPYKHGSQSGVVHTLKYYRKRYLCTPVGEQKYEDHRKLFNRNDLETLKVKLNKLEADQKDGSTFY